MVLHDQNPVTVLSPLNPLRMTSTKYYNELTSIVIIYYELIDQKIVILTSCTLFTIICILQCLFMAVTDQPTIDSILDYHGDYKDCDAQVHIRRMNPASLFPLASSTISKYLSRATPLLPAQLKSMTTQITKIDGFTDCTHCVCIGYAPSFMKGLAHDFQLFVTETFKHHETKLLDDNYHDAVHGCIERCINEEFGCSVNNVATLKDPQPGLPGLSGRTCHTAVVRASDLTHIESFESSDEKDNRKHKMLIYIVGGQQEVLEFLDRIPRFVNERSIKYYMSVPIDMAVELCDDLYNIQPKRYKI